MRLAIQAVLLGCAALSLGLKSSAQVPKPKNVLFIISDDLTTALGSYGHPLAKTHNIDALAKRGVLFERAYCQFPLCNPSRASLMTGRGPDTTGVIDNAVQFRRNIPNVVTLSQVFRNAGYFAARVGKIYHYGVPGQIGTSGLDDAPSWEQVVNPRGRDKDDEDTLVNFTPGRGIGGALTWRFDLGVAEDHTDGKVAENAIKMLETHRDKPFFLAVGFYRPHVPCIAPQRFLDLYPPDKIDIPHEMSHLKQIPDAAFTVRPPNYGIPDSDARTFLRAYLASVSFMDEQVGKVLSALKRLGLEENTVVVMMGDHGWLLGEHGHWQKMSLFEQSARIPLIIAGPGVKQGGRSSRKVQAMDLYPTVSLLAGLTPPAGYEGHSLLPLLTNPNAAWEHHAFTTVTRGGARNQFFGRSVRTERYRYTEWDEGRKGAELYDYTADPNELQNRADDPSMKSVREELSSKLRKQFPSRRTVRR